MILPVLGFSLTQPRPSLSSPVEETAEGTASPFFVLERVGVKARAREINGEFILLAGSTARKQGVPSWTSYRSLRNQLVDAGKLVEGEDPEQLVTVEDIVFSSPSAAGAVVMGRNVNGRQDWRAEDSGETYEDWSAKRLPPASTAPLLDDVE
ncbi:MAG: DUF4357 domain-containing protein [Deltaproteobacteria bacterium]|nr:DUF4357 domain-containing protein [Deltaproteobacteria bacterium]